MDRFLIAPFNSGLQTDLKPWLITDDALARLDNAYVWRGRIRKRFGEVLSGGDTTQSRVAILLGFINGAGNLAGTVPGIVFAIGQQFSVGVPVNNNICTVWQANGAMLQTALAPFTTADYNTANGAYNFVGAPVGDPVYFYVSTPIMGLTQYENGTINAMLSYAFDTQFAYLFSNGLWAQSGTVQWHGTDSDFFWAYNWKGITNNLRSLFVSNFQVTDPNGLGVLTDDPIWSMSRAGITDTWTPFSYSPDSALNPTNQQPYTVTQATIGTGAVITNYVQSALIVIPFKGRLLLLNTIENNANGADAFVVATPTTTGITPARYETSTNSNFVNRCRFSQVGSPFARNAWLETNQVFKPDTVAALLQSAGGGFIDAATDEAIVSAEFIKDRLIVYFENSTWELAYTGNQVDPFTWQKINTELGSQSTFSTIPFDKAVLTIGNVGVHACTGANVSRIDDNIPDNIFTVRENNNGIERIVGIRDYFLEMAYWSYPDRDADLTSYVYPNKVLSYNYKTGAWAKYDDCITAFGYFDLNPNAAAPVGIEARQIIAGNQQGFIFICNGDISQNAEVLQITNITANGGAITLDVINHTLQVNDFVKITNATGTGTGILNDNIYKVIAATNNTVDLGIFDGVTPIGYAGNYNGGGTLTRISKMNIVSKQWNPYVGQDRNVYLSKIDFGVQRTTNGQVQVDYYPSSTTLSMINGATGAVATGTILGVQDLNFPAFGITVPVYNVLETNPYGTIPLENYQDILWHPVQFQTQGTFIQISISMSDAQLSTRLIAESPFQLEGMILYCSPTTARLQ